MTTQVSSATVVQVGIADMAVSTRPDEQLITYSLGSCLGLTAYDPQVGVGGMLHSMLPLSTKDRAKAAVKPLMFTDSGIQTLLEEMFRRGARKRNLVIKLAGGATMLDDKAFFRIGERNVAIARKLMWKNGLLIAATDVGDSVSRTMTLEMSTGRTLIRTNGHTHELE